MIQKDKYDSYVMEFIRNGKLAFDKESGQVYGSNSDLNGNRKPIGFIIDKNVCFSVIINNKSIIYPSCRAIYLNFYGQIPHGHKVIHIDGNPLNNKPSNLAIEKAAKDFNPIWWSEEEETKLLNMYKTQSLSSLSTYFKRSIKAVRHKIKKLNCNKNDSRKKWTAKETEILKENCNKKNMSIGKLAELTGRSEGSIRLRTNRLCGLYKSDFHLREHISENKFYISAKAARLRGSMGFKCCLCDYSKYIDLHHIDGNNKNHHINNIATLCPNHHTEVRAGEHKNEVLYSIWWRIYADGTCWKTENNIDLISSSHV